MLPLWERFLATRVMEPGRVPECPQRAACSAEKLAQQPEPRLPQSFIPWSYQPNLDVTKVSVTGAGKSVPGRMAPGARHHLK